MRSFLAVLPNEPCQQFLNWEIARLQAVLAGVPVRWTAEENLHMTLHFLGNITPALAARLVQHIPAALGARRAFEVPLQGTALFPGSMQPKALAVLSERMPALSGLVSTLRRAAQQAGLRVERQRFRGHITLGRLQNNKKKKLRRDRREAQTASLVEIDSGAPVPSLQVAELVLFESQLRPQGPLYIPLENFPLQPWIPYTRGEHHARK